MLIGTRRALFESEAKYVASDVPQSEAIALIAFYYVTGGGSWTNNDGWLTDPVVANWNGITVSGGHVTEIDLNTNNLVGAAGSSLNLLASSLIVLKVNANSLGVLDIGALIKMSSFLCQDNSMSQGEVDTIVKDIYDHWDAFTDASPELNIGGSNTTPSGTYQDGDPPGTGKEYIYEIVEDPESTGFEQWVVTFTGQ